MKTDHPHIFRREGVCGGEPIIDGLRVAVRHVVNLHKQGESILEIAESLNISEAQAYHALSYFFDHREEIEHLITLNEQAHARFKEDALASNRAEGWAPVDAIYQRLAASGQTFSDSAELLREDRDR